MDIKTVSCEIKSTAGRIVLEGMAIPGYPKLIEPPELTCEMYAECKVDGANIRLVYLQQRDDFIAILRGGMPDQKMTDALHKFSDTFLRFFRENPGKVLCLEAMGRETIANTHAEYYKKFGFGPDVAYFVFDILDPGSERFASYDEKKSICEKYSLSLVPLFGKFSDKKVLIQEMKNLDPEIEGVVLKNYELGEFYKFRFDRNPEIFPERQPATIEKAPEPPEAIVVAHFFQGYEEKELGLDSGISPGEFKQYQELLEKLSEKLTRENVGECVAEVVAFLMKTINAHGQFDHEMEKKIEKEFKKLLGKKIGKFMQKK